MAIGGFLAATFIVGIVLPLIYAGLALGRSVRPSFNSVFRLMASGAAIVAALRLIWLDGFGLRSLDGQDKFYLFVGAVAAGWYGIAGIAATFNKLYGVRLRSEEEAEEENRRRASDREG